MWMQRCTEQVLYESMVCGVFFFPSNPSIYSPVVLEIYNTTCSLIIMVLKAFTCFLLLFLFHLKHASSTNHPLCHEHESSALLNFKNSFFIRKFPCRNAHPQTESWNLRSSRDCCNWDGVRCDASSGHVISLDLSSSCLYGSIDSSSLFQLLHLQTLNLADNDFNASEIPSAIGLFSRLTHLNLSGSYFSGQIPPQVLHLSFVNMSSTVPQALANLASLTSLWLRGCGLHGEFPSSIFNLPHLQDISIRNNPNLTGFFPEVNPGSRLQRLWLGSTGFTGNLPLSIDNLKSLEMLDIRDCSFTGSIPASMTNLTKLTFLDLSDNSFSSQTLPSCLGKLTQLTGLGLEHINLKGEIPPSMSNLTKLNEMSLRSNQLTGNLLLEICSLTRLYFLDISHNNLSGIISDCFGNFSSSLLMLNLNGNNFHGTIPQTFESGCQLRAVNFGQNRLRGRLPRSLVNCRMLEALDIDNNKINDSFPHWLGTLTNLKIVNLRANQFHGVVTRFERAQGFSKLRIIDISHNSFSGNLPVDYFQHWDSMKASKIRNVTYLNTSYISNSSGIIDTAYLPYITELTIKGVEMELNAILDSSAYIDFSSNRFDGAIPESITSLKGLRSLNFSRNHFTGRIPPMWSKLNVLEFLDLSHNHLSEQIPVELTGLSSLAIFDVAYNNLSGLIPQGNQFDTFQNSSYLGNSKLCGNPLSQQCHKIQTSLPSPKTLESTTELNWVVIAMGYASGLVIGVVIGWALTARKHEWFTETFGIEIRSRIARKQQRPRRGKR